MNISVGDITIHTYSDGINPASYELSKPYMDTSLRLYQSEMELLVASLTVLVVQNKTKER